MLDATQQAAAPLLYIPSTTATVRIARAIADLQPSRADDATQRSNSVSAQIRARRYDLLEASQRSSLDLTPWLS